MGLIVSVPPACRTDCYISIGALNLHFHLWIKFCALGFTLFTVPVVAGLIVTVPVPVRLNLISASCPSASKSPVSKMDEYTSTNHTWVWANNQRSMEHRRDLHSTMCLKTSTRTAYVKVPDC